MTEYASREDWLAGRVKYIGSSDAPAILGHGYYGESKTSVWASKVHGITKQWTKEELDRLNEGRIGEEFVLRLCAHRHPQWIVTPSKPFSMVVCESVPYCASSLDGYAGVGAEMVVLEAKVIHREQAKDWGTDQEPAIPMKYFIQCQHQLLCTGWKRALLCAYVVGEYTERWIERDDELLDLMKLEYASFWEHVIAGTPPADDTSEHAFPVLQRVSERHCGVAKALGGKLSASIREYLAAKKELDKVEDRVIRLKNTIGREVMGYEYLVLDDQSAVKVLRSGFRALKTLPRGVGIR